MTDRITQCDVVDCCEDCPRYGDDCDGDKYLDRYPTMHEYAEGKRINPKLTDLISRKHALRVAKDVEDGNVPVAMSVALIDAIPSADAVHTEKLKGMKFVTIKGDKVEEAYRSGWNGAIECVIGNVSSSADAEQGDECDHCVYKWKMKGGAE